AVEVVRLPGVWDRDQLGRHIAGQVEELLAVVVVERGAVIVRAVAGERGDQRGQPVEVRDVVDGEIGRKGGGDRGRELGPADGVDGVGAEPGERGVEGAVV